MDDDLKRLTEKQRLWLTAYLETMNASEAARRAGYRCRTEHGFEVIGSENLKKLEPWVEMRLDELGLSDAALKRKLIDGLDATKILTATFKGEITDRLEVIDWATRAKFLDLALRVKGMYQPEKLQVDQSGGLIVIGTGYPDAEDGLETPDGPQSDENG